MNIWYKSVTLLTALLLCDNASAQLRRDTSVRAETTASEDASSLGQIRASRLVGMSVYNTRNEKIGSIEDVIVDELRVSRVVIDVSGYLGLFDRNISVGLEKLKYDNKPVSAVIRDNKLPPESTWIIETPTVVIPRNVLPGTPYPDHVVLAVTRRQLTAMTPFNY